MLVLDHIRKDYGAGDRVVHALQDVSLRFRKSEFVSILGPSGCGKTTMLNIIGGLDRYTSGDLIIDGVSTKEFQDVDWDAYRNLRVGFIFQSYNLIPHIDICSNVEMALTLSGVSASQARKRAEDALRAVGLGNHLHKRPNQLSGGQMQRVSIARALINDPEIILADEPTGALDSNTSVQIMELLQEIARGRLVIMVTHNAELAEQYSTRILRIHDGQIIEDTNPVQGEESEQALQADSEQARAENEEAVASVAPVNVKGYTSIEQIEQDAALSDKKRARLLKAFARAEQRHARKVERARIRYKKRKLGKTSMSYRTACKLSGHNLMTKKGRTTMTSIAGSIGIIGVALVLAISNGFTNYIEGLQRDVLAGYPVEVARSSVNTNSLLGIMMGGGMEEGGGTKFPDSSTIRPYNPLEQYLKLFIDNEITHEYVEYVEQLKTQGYADSIRYSYGVDMNVIGRIRNDFSGYEGVPEYTKVNNSTDLLGQLGSMTGGGTAESKPSVGWQQLSGGQDYVLSQYDLLAGSYPQNKNQAVLVVDSRNRLSDSMMAALGLPYNKSYVSFDDVLGGDGITLYVATNNAYYTSTGQDSYKVRDAQELYGLGEEDGVIPVKIVGILRQKPDAAITTLSSGVAYMPELTEYIMQDSMASDIVASQTAAGKARNVVTGESMTTSAYNNWLEDLGGIDTPSYIQIFPKDFAAKEQVLNHLDAWNDTHSKSIRYNDMSQFATDFMSEMVRIISIVLICFASVSLLVSSVMIGIITYVSVVERTKEIGILRSLGARKRDISNVFNAETAIIGAIAGVIGVIITYILSIPINLIIQHYYSISGLCALSPLHALLMIAISMGLTIIAGLVPARIASKRDPVVALRTE